MEIKKELVKGNEKTIAFEGDTYILNEVKRLKEQFKIKTFIETGTNEAETTTVMAEIFDSVHTIELNQEFYNNCKEKLKDFKNATIHNGSSQEVMDKILKDIDGPIMFFLDAHWNLYCPIFDELKKIKEYNKKDSVILIHDFKVPNSNLGYMKLPGGGRVDGGAPLDYEVIKTLLDEIYNNNYDFYYNSESDGNPRTGTIFIIPKI